MPIFSGGYMAHEIEYCEGLVGNFRLLNFATGSYTCTCCICGTNFLGDKRAMQCLACALKAVEENCHSTQQLKAEIAYYLSGSEEHVDTGIVILTVETFNKLRQLSAV
jgi:hypothetical protein